MPKPQMPIATALYNVQAVRGVSDRKMLSCTSDSKTVDLWNNDDDSGRQNWRFIELSDGAYNIEVFAGVTGERKYLSCTPEGKVDLWTEDDNSGRQQWKLVPQTNGSFHIEVASGTNAGERYLSCTSDGKTVDLWDRDDNSGRQQWQLLPEDIEIDRVDFDIAKANQLPQPNFISKQTITNDTDLEQGSKVTFAKKATETSSFQREHGFTFSVEAEMKFGTPVFDTGSVKMSASTTNKWTYGSEKSREDTRTYEMPVKIPPHSKVVAKATITQTKLDVPYTAIGTSRLTGETIKCFGKWIGVSAGEIIFSLEQD
jgi:hypothetical protein